MLYSLIKPLLFRLDPEHIHETTLNLSRNVGSLYILEKVLGQIYQKSTPTLSTQIGDLSFENVVGLAAGMDKNGVAVPLWQSLGFGHIEVGTVTPKPQPGNPKPRLFRLPTDQALINRMGFNNHGVDLLVKTLRFVEKRVPVGVNLGKNKATPLEEAALDYTQGLERTWSVGDYFTINISSPNTQNLRDLQSKDSLIPLLKSILKKRDELAYKYGNKKQIWLKIAPDLDETQIELICTVALDLKIDVLIVSNTTIGREGLQHPNRQEIGGMSGKPLLEKSNQILKQVYSHIQGRIPLIGVGGIFTGQDAFTKITLGANLVQVFSGLIYQGPSFAKQINAELLQILKREGIPRIQDAVGIAIHK